MKLRLKAIVIPWLLCGLLGGLYYIWVVRTNIGIPCLFYLWTGLKCPGCGITRLCIGVLSGNLEEAKKVNVLLFYLLPILTIWMLVMSGYYILTGKRFNQKITDVMAWIVVVLLLVFGVYRNIVGC